MAPRLHVHRLSLSHSDLLKAEVEAVFNTYMYAAAKHQEAVKSNLLRVQKTKSFMEGISFTREAMVISAAWDRSSVWDPSVVLRQCVSG